MQRYTAAIEAAERSGERGVLAEALRRLGVVHHHRNEAEVARSLCQKELRDRPHYWVTRSWRARP